jgi:hypothetical protein
MSDILLDANSLLHFRSRIADVTIFDAPFGNGDLTISYDEKVMLLALLDMLIAFEQLWAMRIKS